MNRGPIASVAELDDLLSEPTPGVIDTLGRLEGDLLVLGVGGKMGPTLARMAVRASQAAGIKRRVIGVARFSQPGLPDWLRQHGIEPLQADLLDPQQVARLPDAANVIVMTALKFGSSGRSGDTWAVNCWQPALVCQRFPDEPDRRLFDRQRLSADAAGSWRLARERSADADRRVRGELRRPRTAVRLLQPLDRHAAGDRAAELRLRTAVRRARRSGPADSARRADRSVDGSGQRHLAGRRQRHDAAKPGPGLVAAVCDQRRRARNCFPSAASASISASCSAKSPRSPAAKGPKPCSATANLGITCSAIRAVSIRQLCQWIADWLKSGGELLDKPTKFQVRDGKF